MTSRLTELLTMTGVWVAGLSLAAFLVLYWALRGAPIGQAAEEDADDGPGSAYRDRVVAASVFGLVMVAVGAYVATAVSIPWSLPLFALGFGLVLALVSANRKYRHASPTLRRLVAFADAALTSSLLAGILVVANVLAFKYGGRPIDLTRERSFSLAPLTIRQLKDLDRPVRFTTFFGRSSSPEVGRVVELLELYRRENPSRVALDNINFYRELGRYEEVQKRFPDVNLAFEQGGGVLIEYGEGEGARHAVVRNAELFELTRMSPADPGRFESRFNGEDAITSALIRLREGKTTTVALTTGHGEPSPEQSDPSRPGLGLLRSRLVALGSEVVELDPASGDVDPTIALVIVAGPRSPFTADEARRLRAYLDRGGHMLLMLGRDPVGLDELLVAYRVKFGPGVAFDPSSCLRGRPRNILAPVVGLRHPIVEPLQRRGVLLPDATPIAVGAGGAPASAATTAPLLRTTARAWAEADPDEPAPKFDAGKDTHGPLTVGLAISDAPRVGSPEPPAPRMVLFGSRDLADNRVIQIDPVNLDLVVNAVAWLRGRPELQGIAPKTHESVTLATDPGLRTRLILIPTLLATCTIVGLGVATYLARRA